MAVPGEECRSTRGFQMAARGIFLVIFFFFFLRIGTYFLSHGITTLVVRTEGTEGRVQLVVGGKYASP